MFAQKKLSCKLESYLRAGNWVMTKEFLKHPTWVLTSMYILKSTEDFSYYCANLFVASAFLTATKVWEENVKNEATSFTDGSKETPRELWGPDPRIQIYQRW